MNLVINDIFKRLEVSQKEFNNNLRELEQTIQEWHDLKSSLL